MKDVFTVLSALAALIAIVMLILYIGDQQGAQLPDRATDTPIPEEAPNKPTVMSESTVAVTNTSVNVPDATTTPFSEPATATPLPTNASTPLLTPSVESESVSLLTYILEFHAN